MTCTALLTGSERCEFGGIRRTARRRDGFHCRRFGFLGCASAERRALHHVFVVAAFVGVWQDLALCDHGGISRVDGAPFEFRAGDKAVRRELALIGVVAAGLDAALLR